MKLGLRIFLCHLLVFAVCFSYPISWVLGNLRTRYLEGVEDPLVDQANVLASLVGNAMEQGGFDPDELARVFDSARDRTFSARIYNLEKTMVDTRVYITDSTGMVVFDSSDPENVGKDFSGWRDVDLTLQGEYGARTTLSDPDDPTSAVLYVAAPIVAHNRIAGVLTVGKPTTTINTFLEQAKPRIFKVFGIAALCAVVLAFVVSYLLTRPIGRLTEYANDIRYGKQASFPQLDTTEVGELGRAMERMQSALEGKEYVERYVQTLTHELKSPLSAIQGAAELLGEPMARERRDKFLANIRTEAERISRIVDRMLELAALETKRKLGRVESIAFHSLVKTVMESKRPMLSKKQVLASVRVPNDITVQGDMFLLHQAVSNLVQNAIDFSTQGAAIDLSASADGRQLEFCVKNEGEPIPEYAHDKIFDKFFSLRRPDSGKKSTGLGLNFVREVAHLHRGTVSLKNRHTAGVSAILSVPLQQGSSQGVVDEES